MIISVATCLISHEHRHQKSIIIPKKHTRATWWNSSWQALAACCLARWASRPSKYKRTIYYSTHSSYILPSLLVFLMFLIQQKCLPEPRSFNNDTVATLSAVRDVPRRQREEGHPPLKESHPGRSPSTKSTRATDRPAAPLRSTCRWAPWPPACPAQAAGSPPPGSRGAAPPGGPADAGAASDAADGISVTALHPPRPPPARGASTAVLHRRHAPMWLANRSQQHGKHYSQYK